MAKSTYYYIRKSHRYLGLFLGIQFLIWTVSGLYFSWSNIDEVHGDFQKKEAPLLSSNIQLVSPTLVINNIKAVHNIDSLISIQLIEILGNPFYQVKCMSEMHSKKSSKHSMHLMNHLANAETGELRNPLVENEAIEIAKSRFNGKPEIIKVEFLKEAGTHHEYREQPLPAYAITFSHPSKTTVYVSTELGTVQKYRNNAWRWFDDLWMLHTMDYKTRDNFNNLLLRIFSIAGLITILSGFVLFVISSKTLKRIKKS